MTKRITYVIDGDPAVVPVVLNGEVEDSVAAALADRIEEAIKPPSIEKQIIRWSEEEVLTGPNDGPGLMLNVVEEVGKLASAIARDDKEGTKDAIGEIWVTLIILCRIYGESPSDGDVQYKSSWRLLLLDMSDLAHVIYARIDEEVVMKATKMIRRLDVAARSYGLDARDCLQHAWDRIKEGE